jgi:hypothetical protein
MFNFACKIHNMFFAAEKLWINGICLWVSVFFWGGTDDRFYIGVFDTVKQVELVQLYQCV